MFIKRYLLYMNDTLIATFEEEEKAIETCFLLNNYGYNGEKQENSYHVANEMIWK